VAAGESAAAGPPPGVAWPAVRGRPAEAAPGVVWPFDRARPRRRLADIAGSVGWTLCARVIVLLQQSEAARIA
jgi:hypothetical protein